MGGSPPTGVIGIAREFWGEQFHQLKNWVRKKDADITPLLTRRSVEGALNNQDAVIVKIAQGPSQANETSAPSIADACHIDSKEYRFSTYSVNVQMPEKPTDRDIRKGAEFFETVEERVRAARTYLKDQDLGNYTVQLAKTSTAAKAADAESPLAAQLVAAANQDASDVGTPDLTFEELVKYMEGPAWKQFVQSQETAGNYRWTAATPQQVWRAAVELEDPEHGLVRYINDVKNLYHQAFEFSDDKGNGGLGTVHVNKDALTRFRQRVRFLEQTGVTDPEFQKYAIASQPDAQKQPDLLLFSWLALHPKDAAKVNIENFSEAISDSSSPLHQRVKQAFLREYRNMTKMSGVEDMDEWMRVRIAPWTAVLELLGGGKAQGMELQFSFFKGLTPQTLLYGDQDLTKLMITQIKSLETAVKFFKLEVLLNMKTLASLPQDSQFMKVTKKGEMQPDLDKAETVFDTLATASRGTAIDGIDKKQIDAFREAFRKVFGAKQAAVTNTLPGSPKRRAAFVSTLALLPLQAEARIKDDDYARATCEEQAPHLLKQDKNYCAVTGKISEAISTGDVARQTSLQGELIGQARQLQTMRDRTIRQYREMATTLKKLNTLLARQETTTHAEEQKSIAAQIKTIREGIKEYRRTLLQQDLEAAKKFGDAAKTAEAAEALQKYEAALGTNLAELQLQQDAAWDEESRDESKLSGLLKKESEVESILTTPETVLSDRMEALQGEVIEITQALEGIVIQGIVVGIPLNNLVSPIVLEPLQLPDQILSPEEKAKALQGDSLDWKDITNIHVASAANALADAVEAAVLKGAQSFGMKGEDKIKTVLNSSLKGFKDVVTTLAKDAGVSDVDDVVKHAVLTGLNRAIGKIINGQGIIDPRTQKGVQLWPLHVAESNVPSGYKLPDGFDSTRKKLKAWAADVVKELPLEVTIDDLWSAHEMAAVQREADKQAINKESIAKVPDASDQKDDIKVKLARTVKKDDDQRIYGNNILRAATRAEKELKAMAVFQDRYVLDTQIPTPIQDMLDGERAPESERPHFSQEAAYYRKPTDETSNWHRLIVYTTGIHVGKEAKEHVGSELAGLALPASGLFFSDIRVENSIMANIDGFFTEIASIHSTLGQLQAAAEENPKLSETLSAEEQKKLTPEQKTERDTHLQKIRVARQDMSRLEAIWQDLIGTKPPFPAFKANKEYEGELKEMMPANFEKIDKKELPQLVEWRRSEELDLLKAQVLPIILKTVLTQPKLVAMILADNQAHEVGHIVYTNEVYQMASATTGWKSPAGTGNLRDPADRRREILRLTQSTPNEHNSHVEVQKANRFLRKEIGRMDPANEKDPNKAAALRALKAGLLLVIEGSDANNARPIQMAALLMQASPPNDSGDQTCFNETCLRSEQEPEPYRLMDWTKMTRDGPQARLDRFGFKQIPGLGDYPEKVMETAERRRAEAQRQLMQMMQREGGGQTMETESDE